MLCVKLQSVVEDRVADRKTQSFCGSKRGGVRLARAWGRRRWKVSGPARARRVRRRRPRADRLFRRNGHGGRLRIVERALDDVRQRLAVAERQLALDAGATAAQPESVAKSDAPPSEAAPIAEESRRRPRPSRRRRLICRRQFPLRRRRYRPRRPNLRRRPRSSPPPKRHSRRRARLLLALRLKKGSAPAGPYGSAASRPASARCCSSATRPSRAISARRARAARPGARRRPARPRRATAPRRRRRSAADAAAARANAPAALTAAGVVAAFGSVYAAHALYGFIGAAPRSSRSAPSDWLRWRSPRCTGRRSPVSAWSAPAAPLLVSSDHPSPWPVVLYLLPVAGATYGLARLRRWLWLALAAAAGGVAVEPSCYRARRACARSSTSITRRSPRSSRRPRWPQPSSPSRRTAAPPTRRPASIRPASGVLAAFAALAVFAFVQPPDAFGFDAWWIAAAGALVAVLGDHRRAGGAGRSALALAGAVGAGRARRLAGREIRRARSISTR